MIPEGSGTEDMFCEDPGAERGPCCCAGEIIKPQGAFQYALFWLMPVIQPLLSLLMAGVAAFAVAFAGVSALHFQPYVAPLLVIAFALARLSESVQMPQHSRLG